MKALHRPDLHGWATFDCERNIDFNGVLWTRPGGNVLVDPVPLSAHDEQHLKQLGGAAHVVVTNSDHVRASKQVAEVFGAALCGPSAERDSFPIACQRWLGEGDEVVSGLRVLEMHGSKTPGELALLLEDHTLITGDLVRAHRGGSLMMLPAGKLRDANRAKESVRRLAELNGIDAVLVGDGWPVFRDGTQLLRALVADAA